MFYSDFLFLAKNQKINDKEIRLGDIVPTWNSALVLNLVRHHSYESHGKPSRLRWIMGVGEVR